MLLDFILLYKMEIWTNSRYPKLSLDHGRIRRLVTSLCNLRTIHKLLPFCSFQLILCRSEYRTFCRYWRAWFLGAALKTNVQTYRKFITHAQVPLLSKFASANKDQWGFKMNETDFQVKLRLWMQSQNLNLMLYTWILVWIQRLRKNYS